MRKLGFSNCPASPCTQDLRRITLHTFTFNRFNVMLLSTIGFHRWVRHCPRGFFTLFLSCVAQGFHMHRHGAQSLASRGCVFGAGACAQAWQPPFHYGSSPLTSMSVCPDKSNISSFGDEELAISGYWLPFTFCSSSAAIPVLPAKEKCPNTYPSHDQV